MKKLHVALVLSVITIICLSSGLAAANITQNELTTQTTWSKPALPQGNGVVVTITVQSNSDKQLQVYYFGVHFDWMEQDRFIGQNLQSDPVTIPSGGSYQFSPSIINIPSDVSLGSHSYFIGIDGEDSNGQPFSWNSAEATIQVVQSSTSTGPNSSNSDGTINSSNDWTLGIVVIAVTAIVMVVIILMVLRRKRRSPAPAPAESSAPAPEQPQQPQPPEESPAPEQEFNI